MVAEKRSQGRLLTSVTVRVRVEDTPDDTVDGGATFICQTRDMSLAGICLLSQAPIPARSRLLLEVQVDSPDNIFKHRAEVIWCREADGAYLIGVHIMDSMCDELVWKNTVINILVG